LTGDFHSSTVADLRADPYDSRGSIVATEFMAPAISSAFPNALRALAPLMLALNPQVHHFDPDNGYMTCEVTESTWTTRLHRLADVTAESSAIAEVARFTVNDGTPGIATVEITE
jgi:alkaline phosphatase D